ncbi:MAG: 3-methyl-2-oxobutanoate hydroxymethyltransferase [Acidimicrobiales bacterium]
MSTVGVGKAGVGRPGTGRVTVPDVRARKGTGQRLVMLTAYDAPGARVADAGGVDLILVGDSVATAVLGYDNTLQATVDDMVHHVGAVARTEPRALIVGDLPWLSYHTGPVDSVVNAGRLIRAGAGAVKLEGGRKRLPVIRALADAEIPVMGHIGLTPQSVLAMGGFKVQARAREEVRAMIDDAGAIAAAGVFAIVLEGIPDAVARLVTEAVAVPTLGIGAGRHCDGQVLVFHDLLGLGAGSAPKFVRRYAALGADAVAAVARWATDVRDGTFPDDSESYHLPADIAGELGQGGWEVGEGGNGVGPVGQRAGAADVVAGLRRP